MNKDIGKIPQIRFKEFENAGAWEQRELDLLIKKNTEKNKNQRYNNVESVSNKFGFIKQDEYFEDRKVASKNTENYYVIRKNAFAYNPSRINVGSVALKENDDISIVSPLYISFYLNNSLEENFFKE